MLMVGYRLIGAHPLDAHVKMHKLVLLKKMMTHDNTLKKFNFSHQLYYSPSERGKREGEGREREREERERGRERGREGEGRERGREGEV